MIVVGIIVSDTPPLYMKVSHSFNGLKHQMDQKYFLILLRVNMCCIDLIHYFATRICLLIYGTCSLALARLTCGTTGM